jgi:hypothetical protein
VFVCHSLKRVRETLDTSKHRTRIEGRRAPR